MTRKKFIKTLRAYRFSRDEINTFVNEIVNKQGRLSYSDAVDAVHKIWLTICKQIINSQPSLSLDWNYKPLEFVDTSFYETDYIINYKLFGIDLANELDKCVIVRAEV